MADYPVLETARLILRPATMADAGAVQRLFPQWEIVRYLVARIPWPYPEDGAQWAFREIDAPAIARGESWVWSIFPRSEPERLIGRIDLSDAPDNNRGFWIDPAFAGRGLMSEAADAVTDYWFDVLGRPVLRAPKAVANEASRRISIRQGMRMIATGEKDYVSGRLPYELWEITAEEWRTRKSHG